MPLRSTLMTARRRRIQAAASETVRLVAALTVIVLLGLDLVSAEHYFDPDHQLNAAHAFVSP
jgi:hypothetical protein